MAKAGLDLSLEQELRDKYLTILLDRPNPPKVQDAMLMVAPVVEFVIGGQILGIDSRNDGKPLPRARSLGNAARSR